MAASRKLQGEIDRCLKKVQEGVDQFQDIWKKVYNATNSNQKEKYEADLKKEIKKLQRLRDQIKSWLQSAEIKDKSQLLEYRKLIETQMERFKVVERETKTKAYSKEGLGAAQNKDPAQRERDETNRWLSECIDVLNLQVDQFECEMESFLAAGKKKKMDKDKSGRLEDLRDWLEKHRFHIKKLEILMRMLNNESVDCDQIKSIKDDVEHYIESSQDPDFVGNDNPYEDIPMEDLDYPTPEITNALGNHDSTDGSTPSSSVCGSSPAPSPAAPITNHSTTDHGPIEQTQLSVNNLTSALTTSSHHERKRPNKEEQRTGTTPVKPQVVRPPPSLTSSHISTVPSSVPVPSSVSLLLANSHCGLIPGSKKATPPPLTPTKPVSGSTSQSTPNNSSTSSGLLNHLSSSSSHNNRESSHASTVLSHNALNSHNISISSLSSPSISNISISSSNTLNNSTQHTSSAQQNGPSLPPIGTAPSSSCNLSIPTSTGGIISSNLSSLMNNSVNSASSSGTTLAGSSLLASLGGVSGNSSGVTVVTSLSSLLASSVVGSMNSSQGSLMGSSMGNAMDSNPNSLSLKSMVQSKLSEVNTSLSSSTGPTSPSPLSNSFTTANTTQSLLTSTPNSLLPPSTQLPIREKPPPGPTSEAHIQPFLGVAPLGPACLTPEHKLQYERLQAAFFHMPHPSDSERFRLHFPRQPCQTATYYPQVPPPMSDTVDFFQRLSTETLFFIFYYMEGSKAQYLAAKALKKQSWRFHTKYMMWFQRHEEPKAITDEFEQGTYIFFDYENWGQRKKENFIFEYRYLEDRDLN